MNVKRVVLAEPHGFCAGVARAVKVVEDTLSFLGVPVYVKHEIVHNNSVVARLAKKGAITVEKLNAVPDGSVVIFSAHGSPQRDYEEATQRNLHLIDATCPLVTKVHLEVRRYLKEGYQIIYIGHRGHVEGVGVLGEVPQVHIPLVETPADVQNLVLPETEKMIYLTQTTLSLDETKAVIQALQEKYPTISAPPLEDICFATTNRQEAVKWLAKEVEVILVIGSQTSSNSQRLREVGEAAGVRSYLIEGVEELHPEWFQGTVSVGVTGGASAPEDRIESIVRYFTDRGAQRTVLQTKEEKMVFAEPIELQTLRQNQKHL